MIQPDKYKNSKIKNIVVNVVLEKNKFIFKIVTLVVYATIL